MNEVGQFRRMNQCFQIKERFKDDEERYKDFLSIMIELKDKGYQKLCFCLQCRIGDRSVIQRLKYVFEGNTDLLKKFTMFLPPDYDTDFLFDQPFYHHFNHVLLEQCFFQIHILRNIRCSKLVMFSGKTCQQFKIIVQKILYLKQVLFQKNLTVVVETSISL